MRGGSPAGRQSTKRLHPKNPFTPEEAFRIDGEASLFNAMKLNDRIDHLSWMENIFTMGSFEWVDGSMESHKVTFRPRKR